MTPQNPTPPVEPCKQGEHDFVEFTWSATAHYASERRIYCRRCGQVRDLTPIEPVR